ncbi:hypothetical protein N2152v2_007990 [Parachlorella kessleri]
MAASLVALTEASLSQHTSWKLLAVRPDNQPAPCQALSDFPYIPAPASTAPIHAYAHLDLSYLLVSAPSTWDGCTCLILGTPAPAPPSLGQQYNGACQALVLRAGCLLTYAAVARSEPEPSTATADTVADSCAAMAATQPASISSDSDTWTMQY